MPLPSSINKKEYFEIEDFIQEQNMKVQALEWKAYINRNELKLNQYWKTWYGRHLTNKELYRLASGSSNPLNQKTEYQNAVKSFKGRQTMYSKQGQAAKAKKVGQSIKALQKGYGKPLEDLLKEYQSIQQYEAVKYGAGQGLGYNISSIYGGK